MNTFTKGLNPKTEDVRDFSVGALYTLPPLKDLPKEFLVGTPLVKDQRLSDFCSAFSSCADSELQENVELSPEWAFAVGKMIAGGDVDDFGLQLRDICKVHQKYGCIEAKDAPFNVNTKDPTFLRRIENWPANLFDKALYHKKASFFEVTNDYDYFDTLRASIYKFNAGALIGVRWGWNAYQKIMDTIPTSGNGHAMAVIGYKQIDGKDYLIVQNSGGTSIGDGGRHYFSREVINHFVNIYGAFMFLDISKEKAQEYLDKGIKADSLFDQKSWLMERLLGLYRALLTVLSKNRP